MKMYKKIISEINFQIVTGLKNDIQIQALLKKDLEWPCVIHFNYFITKMKANIYFYSVSERVKLTVKL